jgi:hypothetical protein
MGLYVQSFEDCPNFLNWKNSLGIVASNKNSPPFYGRRERKINEENFYNYIILNFASI